MKTKNYRLVKISKKEIKRRNMKVYKLSNCSVLIALHDDLKEYKAKDNTTWGHIFKGNKSFGMVLKKYKNIPNSSIFIICVKPQINIVGIKSFSGGYTNLFNGHTNYKIYDTLKAVAQSNKDRYGISIGYIIN